MAVFSAFVARGVNWGVVCLAVFLYAVLFITLRTPTNMESRLRQHVTAVDRSGNPSNPKVASSTTVLDPVDNAARRDAVVQMARHAWRGYMAHAKGHDELAPLTNTSKDNWGRTLPTAFDAMTFFMVADLSEEFGEAAALVGTSSFDGRRRSFSASVFETTIRHIGASLSVYSVLPSPSSRVLLQKAIEIADALLPAFDTPTGIAMHQVSLGTNIASNEHWCNGKSILAEVGTLQMEFRLLSELSGNPIYAEQATKFTAHLLKCRKEGWPMNPELYDRDAPHMKHRGLWPTFIDPATGRWSGAASLASLSDSFYEYLLKQWILFGSRPDDPLLELYEDAVDAILTTLLRYSAHTHRAFVGHDGFGFEPTLDHLACFVPGMLTLGVMHGAHASRPGRPSYDWTEPDVVAVAMDLAATCYSLYIDTPTGIGPEVVNFNRNGSWTIRNPKYILRPELIESLFYLYRYTADERYRDWGWHIVRAIETHCRTPAGYTAISSVMEVPSVPKDSMESFFFSETLKYLYLLFSSPSLVPLDTFVFNTEGHPFRIVRSASRQQS